MGAAELSSLRDWSTRPRSIPNNPLAPAAPEPAGSAHDLDPSPPAAARRQPGAQPAAAGPTAEADQPATVIAALVAGLLAGYGIAIPVGAVATYLLALTARTSLKVGAAAALGVATADGLYALTAALGGTALARAIQPIMIPLRWASVLVLLALAAKTATTALSHHRTNQAPRTHQAPHTLPATTRTPPTPTPTPTRVYAGLLGVTLLNPTTVVYFAALVLGSQTTTAPPDRLKQALFVLGAFAASASWQLLLAAGGALLGKALTGDRGKLFTALASSTLIAILALRLLAAAI